MKGARLVGLVALIAALHVAVFSVALGPSLPGALPLATLGAVVLGGLAWFLIGRKRG